MRKIEYRVWDSLSKQFSNCRNLFLGSDGLLYCIMVDSGEIIYTHLDIHVFHTQQYTGVNDKMGKRIYEGDIVKYQYETYEHKREIEIGEVYFNFGNFFFCRKNQFCTVDCNFKKDSLEVIGNIFENKELLS